MPPRTSPTTYLSNRAARALSNLLKEIDSSGLEKSLLWLVKIRGSQMNGCAYCIGMHTEHARTEGETEQRLYALNAWRETQCFNDRERAALAWTETVTRAASTRVPDDVYESVRGQFTELELVALTFAVVAINGWSRLAISLRTPAGTYQPQAAA
jgi:AhpD family alkylhydroperoxidase